MGGGQPIKPIYISLKKRVVIISKGLSTAKKNHKYLLFHLTLEEGVPDPTGVVSVLNESMAAPLMQSKNKAVYLLLKVIGIKSLNPLWSIVVEG